MRKPVSGKGLVEDLVFPAGFIFCFNEKLVQEIPIRYRLQRLDVFLEKNPVFKERVIPDIVFIIINVIVIFRGEEIQFLVLSFQPVCLKNKGFVVPYRFQQGCDRIVI